LGAIQISTFIALNNNKFEKTFIHIAESNPFHFRIATTDLPFVVASACPTKDKGFCPAGSHEENQKPNVHRQP
jgi:hypothetical protein